MDNQRNLLLAVVLSGLLILGWDLGMRAFYPEPAITPASASGASGPDAAAPKAPAARLGGVDEAAQGVAAASAPRDLKSALASPGRIAIDTSRVAGSINPVGLRIDDIVLKDHRETVDKDSGPVRLLAPEGTPNQHFAEFGFVVGGKRLPSTIRWQADGEMLTPQTPVTLTHTDAAGITYQVQFAIDDDFMITAERKVTNASPGAEIIQPFALINRTSRNASLDEFLVHSGPVGVFGGALWDENNYEDLAELGRDTPQGAASWLGFTDRYWLSALVPGAADAAGENADIEAAGFRSLGSGLFRTDLLTRAETVPAGGSITSSVRLFAGAKDSAILDAYEESGITNFGKAISWGWFQIIEKPILWLLLQLNKLVGNFGVAIILLTVFVRALMFPIAQKGFASMAAMKAVQPKMKALQERYKDDKERLQQEMMKLYKDEKVNPLSGCLPMLLQVPVFFALYKVLILSIEMRHEPFIAWIKDLSAPDPAHILNLFGLLPFEVVGFLAIGPLAILLGVTMWLTFKLNPAAMDPVQQQIFAFMPWILMFVMAPFAAGLLLYWVTSNILTLAQQSYLYSKHPQLKAAAAQERADAERKKAQG